MTTYFKGTLVLSDNIKLKTLKFNSNKSKDYSLVKVEFIKSNYKLNFDENMNLLEIMLYVCRNIDNDTKKIICKLITNEKIEMSIIYEKIYDNNGNEFAKEIYTGLIFPLFNYNNLDVDLDFKVNHDNKDLISVKGSFNSSLSFNDDTIKCYCFEDDFASKFTIENYKSEYHNSVYEYNKFGMCAKRKSIILHDLYDMNNIDMSNFNEQPIIKYFCSNVQPLKPISNNDIINNSPTTENNPNSVIKSAVEQTIDDAKPIINNDDRTNSNNYSFLLQKQTATETNNLEDIKKFIKLLPEEDNALLMDTIENDFNDPNILKYIKMSREEKLEFLNNKSKEKKPKVSLKKK